LVPDQLVTGNPSPPRGTGLGKLANWLDGRVDASFPVQPSTGRPDVILLHAGTNDLNPAGDQSSLWTTIGGIRTTINNWEASNWPVTVIYSRIINTSPTNTETTTFNNNVRANVVLPAISSNDQAIWVNHESALSSSDFSDYLHPNETGYAKMADVWLYPLTGTGTSSSGDLYPTGITPGFLPKCP